MIEIKGITWKVQLLTKQAYLKAHTDESMAHVNKHDRTIVFRKDFILKNVIIHEVMHAYIAGCHLGSCNSITIEDFEEIVCELMEDHHADIGRTSREVLQILKELK